MRTLVLRLTVVAVLAGGASVASAATALATTYHFQNTGTFTCLTSNGGGAGADLEMYSCNGDANQTWSLVNVSGGQSIANSGDGLCVSDDGNLSNYAQLTMQDCNGNANQTFGPDLSGGVAEFPTIGPNGEFCISSLGNTNNNAPVQLHG